MKVLLTALSAKHIHKTLAPWCLKAYCDQHVQGCEIIVQEHTINDHVGDIAAEIFQSKPDIVGFSCYIWNIETLVKVALTLKKYLPACKIVLGGPEVSFEADDSAYPFADYIVQGAGELAFADLLREMRAGHLPPGKVIRAEQAPDLNELPSPYTTAYYKSFAEGRMLSIKNQLVYYESSRGCPFSCTYCLSSTVCGVQELALERVFSDLDALQNHGASCIKFVDRTFNANRGRALEIFRYIRALETDCTFHFEAAADLFDAELLQVISAMPPGRVQFEIGVQSVNEQTLAEIHRSMDVESVLQNIQTLAAFGNCHVHVDLIAGLPGETMRSFAEGVNACIRVRPHMLQLGFLKLLKGTKIRNDSAKYRYVYSEFPPYEVLQSAHMSFADMIALKRIETVVDKFYNSGRFANSVHYAIEHVFQSAYHFFEALADFCKEETLRTSLKRAYTIVFRFLCQHMDEALAAHYIKLDCFTYNAENTVPDRIALHRNKAAESEFRKDAARKHSNVKVEFFEYDQKMRVFVYDEKDAVGRGYRVLVL